MKNIFKKNQVIIAALAIMIIVAGYLNFTRDKVGDDGTMDANASPSAVGTQADGDLDITGDPDSVVSDTNDVVNSNNDSDTDASKVDADNKAGDAVLANNTINADFFISNKLQREQVRAANEASLQEIIDNKNVNDKQKQKAIDAMIELTTIKDKENATETLLEAKGFPDTLVTITEGSVEVVVNANKLTEQQMAQIEDVVKRKTGISAKNIVISPVNVKANEDKTEEDTVLNDTKKDDTKNEGAKDSNQKKSTDKDAETEKDSAK